MIRQRKKHIRTAAGLCLMALLAATGGIRTLGDCPGSYEVSWRVVYTDSTHTMTIADTKEGTCPNGTEIYVEFPNTVYVGREVWETAEIPGKRVISGPGLEIIYIIYEKTADLPEPEDPYAEAKGALAYWIQKAKEAESKLTGKEVSQIADDTILCDTEGKARLRLISAAGFVEDAGSHDVYLIARELVPTGICLKEAFGSGIVYSHEVMEEIEMGGDLCRVHRFGIRKSYGDVCSHKYEVTVNVEPTCIKRGVMRYRCSLCGEEKTVYQTATGHTDEDHDTICDVCEQSVDTPVRDTRWYLGDTVSEVVGGKTCLFRCVDEDYVDFEQNHTHCALFLCDTVLPASLGGEYREEDDGTGHLVKVWYPGPIAEFGTTGNYKKSKVKAFLDDSGSKVAKAAEIGVSTSFVGMTEAGKFSQLNDESLSAYDIGYQLMEAKLFCLSVEEAVRYRQYLWKFNGSSTDNPETMRKGTCSGYWLRTPSGNASTYDETDAVYIVDLDRGNIHPAGIHPTGTTGDPYIDTQTTIGVRPVFLVDND